MNNIFLKDIPNTYKISLKQIDDQTIRKIYLNFDLLYFSSDPFDKNATNNLGKCDCFNDALLFNYLKNFKFITYQISDIFSIHNDIKMPDFIPSSDSEEVGAIFCIEKECLIIERIDILTINSIINKLKRLNLSLLNVSSNYKNNEKTDDEIEANKEINNFCSFIKILNEIKKDKFISYSIRPMIGYLIRRYFYPTDYFKDQAFFTFDQSTKVNEESNFQTKISKLLLSDKTHISTSKEINYKLFDEGDFIALKTLYNNEQAIYSLAIHCQTLYICLMKKLKVPGKKTKENIHEIEFCEQFENRCLTHFYGFVIKNENIIGLIYEYMSNSSLDSYKVSDQNQMNELYSLMTIIRIFQGINFLHSHSLIYRDLKPSNILIDHDFIPYISDFPTIRHPIEEDLENEEYTKDVGTQFYMSPEQFEGQFITYSTDIFSFGMIIYFLYGSEDIKSIYNKIYKNDEFELKLNASDNLQKLFNSCINKNPFKRINREEILKLIINEINNVFSNNLSFDSSNLNQRLIYQFFYEIFQFEQCRINKNICNKYNQFIQQSENNDIIHYFSISELVNSCKYDDSKKTDFKTINQIICYFYRSEFHNDVVAQRLLGGFYYEGKYIPVDIKKSIYYYTLASKQNDVISNNKLAEIYYEGKYVQRDINKSILYFTYASNQNNLNALNNLGIIYYEGKYIERDINKSLHFFTLSANQNNPTGQYHIGYIYYEGEYISRDMKKAIYYLTLAGNQNNVNAQYVLGDIYLEGVFVPIDVNKSIHYLTLAANQNFPEAQNKLGEIYYEGDHLPADINKSIHYFTLAANQNHPEALFNLGNIYYEGKFFQPNINKSIHYLTLAANQNNSNAQYVLGEIFYEDEFVPMDINKSIHYFELAANQDHIDAQITLGDIYYEGEFISFDIEKSIYYYTQAANKNDPDAQNKLGEIYYEGKHVPRDIDKSIHYFTLAADQNHQDASFILGNIYLEGKYVSRDINKSIHYLTVAANQNDPHAQNKLGEIFYEGKYIPKDISKAIRYFTSAAEQDISNAQYILGHIYFEGDQVSVDIKKSIYYLRLAANHQNVNALYDLGMIYYDGEHVSFDINKSIHYFTLAANQNDAFSQFILAMIYYDNEYVSRDINKSLYYFTLAADQNISKAQYMLGVIYYEGIFVSRDINKSINYLTLSADQSEENAQNMLGYIYYEGKYIDRDMGKSIHYLSLSAMQNHPSSQCLLGYIFYEGRFIQRDLNRSIHFLTSSANQNYSNSQYILGMIYLREQSVRNNIKGLKLIQYASNNRFREAQLALGDLYLEGILIKYDIKEAIHLYKEVSCFYNQFAKNNLGVIYKCGVDNVNTNIHLAKEYFEEAVNQKQDKVSMFNLSNILLDEEENAKLIAFNDPKKSINLLINSSLQGFSPSKVLLSFLLIKKYHYSIDFDVIQNELNDCDLTKEINQYCEMIQNYFSDKKSFQNEYLNIRKTYYVYILFTIKQFQKVGEDKNHFLAQMSKLQNINDEFYKGFGINIHE